MSCQSAISFLSSRPISFSGNVSARMGLLAELDRKMAAHNKASGKVLANCPEHLYSIDTDKMEAARLVNA